MAATRSSVRWPMAVDDPRRDRSARATSDRDAFPVHPKVVPYGSSGFCPRTLLDPVPVVDYSSPAASRSTRRPRCAPEVDEPGVGSLTTPPRPWIALTQRATPASSASISSSSRPSSRESRPPPLPAICRPSSARCAALDERGAMRHELLGQRLDFDQQRVDLVRVKWRGGMPYHRDVGGPRSTDWTTVRRGHDRRLRNAARAPRPRRTPCPRPSGLRTRLDRAGVSR